MTAETNWTISKDSLSTNTTDLASWTFAPRVDWSEMSDTEHFVQFYEADGFLLNSLSGFVGSALSADEPAVIVATQAHRDGLNELLTASGLDVGKAMARGKYVVLDAADTLAKFMIDGAPEVTRFNDVLGGVLASVTDGRARVRAFGEMVALLWAEGNYTGAIKLEELWNDLQKSYSFSLFCAYPMQQFGGPNLAQPHDGVCKSHSRVLPAESYAGLAHHDERLRAIARLQQKARSLEAEIEERQRVEERLRLALVGEQMARAEAEAANRMKDQFLATVSHELRTPLNAIIGWSHLLKSGKLDQTTASRALETIDRNAKSQAQLIEDILDVSRVITGKLRLNKEPVDISAVINAAIDSVKLAVDSKNLHLAVTLDPTARHTLGDSNRLQQVVWNLLSNAIKFTPKGGQIAVNVGKSGSNLQIQVADNGEGITQEFLPHIFERFRQADGTSTRQHGGLGLGLAIVRHLIELHGGTIQAESAGEGMGATFTIHLPLAAAPGVQLEPQVSNRLADQDTLGLHVGSLPSLAGVKVLLVDDDQDTVQILSMILGESQAGVQTASSVTEALEIFEWYQPDVVVSDLAMPDADGYELIRKLRGSENGKRIPAVALTSYVRVEDRAHALSAGFNMFVPKPVEPEELITAIANLIEEPPN